MLNSTHQKGFKEKALNLIILGLIFVTALVTYWLDQGYYVNLVSRVVIFAIAGVGLNLALGYGGMVSLGHAAFFGIGGYIAGISAMHFSESTSFIAGLDSTNQMLTIWLFVIIICALLALFIGLISLRTSGVYFIMITLAFAQMVYYFAISWPDYGGEDGLLISSRNQFLGNDTDNELVFFLICFTVLLLTVFLSSRIIRSRFGTALQVARMNDVRLATVGIRPYPIKLTAFVISAVITGIAGALFADLNRFVSPDMLSWQMSGEIIIFILLGGVGRLSGPILGATLFVLLETFIGGYTEHWKLFLGLVLLIVVLYANGGLMKMVVGEKQHD
ncbi:branched-chain amino acid ABC transporter permease [Cocleimonas flava]|uniref:Amino acid/amide ABC transporter membrane protein 2 (HAAT family) n=1 Tax=Cocleimonas flava TaxID=634765 RepID=A0A4R1F658_9GAMM|nr:branched-chain amino acid ABC transporter permease [Cocleimonas flava]TCJ87348.1 amino acid/amide ABC transporter membrane protein 2 (HAAT family) [Cocleimonas flava]